MPRPKGPALTRDAIIDAAIDCLNAEGADGFGINRVARALGIKPPSLYHHFASNEDLRLAVALEGWSRLARDFEAAAQSASPTAQTLKQMADAYRSFARTYPQHYALMSATPLNPEEPTAGAVAERIIAILASIFPPLRQPHDQSVHAVRALRAAMHGFVMLELSGQFTPAPSAEASYNWMIESFAQIAIRSEAHA